MKIRFKMNSVFCCSVTATCSILTSFKNRVLGHNGAVLVYDFALDKKKRTVVEGELQVQWE